MRRRRSGRKLNVQATLANYKQRLEALPAEDFQELEGAYLTTFDVFGTVVEPPPSSASPIQSHAIVLMEVARAKNVEIKAVTSERKTGGQYICHELLGGDTRDDAKCVYVGKYNYFTGHTHSKWAIKPCDRVLCAPAASPPSR